MNKIYLNLYILIYIINKNNDDLISHHHHLSHHLNHHHHISLDHPDFDCLNDCRYLVSLLVINRLLRYQ